MGRSSLVNRAASRLRRAWVRRRENARVRALSGRVRLAEESRRGARDIRPVVFFNASTRLAGVSLNAGFSLLTGWSLRTAGVPVVHFVCGQGMKPCVLGTQRDEVRSAPPCAECIAQSRSLYAGADTRWFDYRPDAALESALAGLDVAALQKFEYEGIPLGALTLPALRWILRLHHLPDDTDTCYLFRQYILSAYSLAGQFAALLEDVNPQSVVVFNGQFYPEATARWVAQRRGLRVISHEVGLAPFTAYFTPGEATAYPIDIDPAFQLSDEQNARLNGYLEKRFQGNFSMAGVRFWPEMKPLGEEFWQRARQFEQIVPVFTNVVFDTSQGHANVLYPHMFAWLDDVLQIIRANPRTFFVIRAHPDEARSGKASRESVADWVRKNRVDAEPNVLFVDASEYFSSYELIQNAKFVLVYNSTIGLEATLLGAAVLCAGRARFTQIPTVFFPPGAAEFRKMAAAFLQDCKITVPPEFAENARRFLYYQVFRTSLPFGGYLEEDGIWQGYVRLKDFDLAELLPERSPVFKAIHDGILRGGDFLLPGS